MSLLREIVVGIVIALLAEEFIGWLDRCSWFLLRFSARQMPTELRERFEEEWLRELQDKPGKLSRFVFAAGLSLAARSISRDHERQQQIEKDATAKSEDQISASGLTMTVQEWDWNQEKDDEGWWRGELPEGPVSPVIISAAVGTIHVETHATLVAQVVRVEEPDSMIG